MFSKACEYGLRAVIFIGLETKKGKKINIKDICREIEAPEFFTAKILQNLSRMRVISSAKGINGGFFMDKGAENIPLINIVEAIDGNKLFTGCGLGMKECSEDKPCPIHHEFKNIRNSLRQLLADTTISDITMDLEKGLVFLKK